MDRPTAPSCPHCQVTFIHLPSTRWGGHSPGSANSKRCHRSVLHTLRASPWCWPQPTPASQPGHTGSLSQKDSLKCKSDQVTGPLSEHFLKKRLAHKAIPHSTICNSKTVAMTKTYIGRELVDFLWRIRSAESHTTVKRNKKDLYVPSPSDNRIEV